MLYPTLPIRCRYSFFYIWVFFLSKSPITPSQRVSKISFSSPNEYTLNVSTVRSAIDLTGFKTTHPSYSLWEIAFFLFMVLLLKLRLFKVTRVYLKQKSMKYKHVLSSACIHRHRITLEGISILHLEREVTVFGFKSLYKEIHIPNFP